MSRAPLGEICVDLGLLDAEGVRAALGWQADRPRTRFGEAALALGLLDEDGLARALATQHGLNALPGARLARLAIAPEVLSRVPPALARERHVVPALYDEARGVLSVLAADPGDLAALRAVKAAAGVTRLRVFVAAAGAIRALLARLLPEDRGRVVYDEPWGLASPPPGGVTLLFEPSPHLAEALRGLEALERGGAEIVSDPALIAPMLEGHGGGRLFYRSAVAPAIEASLQGWRRRFPGLHVCAVARWSERHAVPWAAARDFCFSALERALLATDDPTHAADSRRYVRLVHALALALALPEETREAMVLVALLTGADGGEDGTGPLGHPWALRASRVPPWDLARLERALVARSQGGDLPAGQLPVEVLYTARALVRAGIPDGADPHEALGPDAIRHDGAVLEAARAVLQREGLRRRVATAGARSSRVLLAILDPVERVAIEARLLDAGFETLATADAPGALALARVQPPAVALVDQRLAPRDGLTLLADLSRDRGTRAVPVLLLVDRDRPRTVTRAFELGAADVVERPVDLDDVTLRLRRAIDKAGVDDTTLTGRLEELSLQELVRTLSRAATTGRVLVAGPRVHGEIHVREGRVERSWLADSADATPVDAPPELFGDITEGGFEVRFGEGALLPRRAVVVRPSGE